MKARTTALIVLSHVLVIGYILCAPRGGDDDTGGLTVVPGNAAPPAPVIEVRTDAGQDPEFPAEVPVETTVDTITPSVPPALREEAPSSLVAAARRQVGRTDIYDSRYVVLKYPGGDIPIERGVCTDVVIRALRDALKMDLQKLVHEDMTAAFDSYPRMWGLGKPDRNIDHRRVPNLGKYFERKGYAVSATGGEREYLPGDIVTCTLPRNRTHIMIVSDRNAADGTPLVIHNIGQGAKEEPCLGRFPVTGHYRIGVRPRAASIAPSLKAGEGRRIHVYVALADNRSQGIAPVPAKLGDGNDHANNLYWGAMYGVKTFLRKSSNWEAVISFTKPEAWILERCVFRHRASDALLTADAYRGSEIRRAVRDFLAAAGDRTSVDLAVYVGHNGLMDFTLEPETKKAVSGGADTIVLACDSKPYFMPLLTLVHADPVLLTTGAMAPEAYTLEAAVEGWIRGESADQTRERAAIAYSKYQKCGAVAARSLFYCE